jgi:hypothetical protein
MMLDAMTKVGSSLSSLFSGAGSVLGEAGAIAAAHPVLATVATAGGYALFGGSNNPPYLGQNIDTAA